MLESFEQSISRFPEVMECYLMTGNSDYLLRVVVRDTIELQHFIIERLSKARGVANIKSSFALKQVKYKTALPESVLVGSRPPEIGVFRRTPLARRGNSARKGARRNG